MSPANDHSDLTRALEMALEAKGLRDEIRVLQDCIKELLAEVLELRGEKRELVRKLVFQKPDPTYSLVDNGGCSIAITCLKCGFTSHNNHDIDNLYCGKCKQFHLKA